MTRETNAKPITAGIPSAPLWAYAIRFAGKAHQKNLARLMEFEPLKMARMDEINEELLAEYVKWRSSQRDNSWLKTNRELEALGRVLCEARQLYPFKKEHPIIPWANHYMLYSTGGKRMHHALLPSEEEAMGASRLILQTRAAKQVVFYRCDCSYPESHMRPWGRAGDRATRPQPVANRKKLQSRCGLTSLVLMR